MILGLPFDQVWACDFEYVSRPGELPEPVCMVAKELGTGRVLRQWKDELGARPPFDISERSLFISYNTPAEFSCFLQLGWPLPARILDLYAEFRREVNGLHWTGKKTLLDALDYHGIGGITKEEKDTWRNLVLTGGPWTDDERAGILDYCQGDVDPLGPLLERMLPHIWLEREGLGQALLRGRYMAAVARMERNGVPIDLPLLTLLRERWADIKLALVLSADELGVYDGTTFKIGLFADALARRGILDTWPRTPGGQPKTDNDTLKDMARVYPWLETFRQLHHAMGQLRLTDLEVGADGRNRAAVMPFGTKTGRNTPSNSRFIFGPAVWLRGLIKPGPGRAIAYIDYSSQEVWIAAALSGDRDLFAVLYDRDIYLDLAVRAGIAPAGATKATHEPVRNMCKTAMLGTRYGMQSVSLAQQTGLHEIEARNLLRTLEAAYPVYAEWAERETDLAQLRGWQSTVFGWLRHVGAEASPPSLRNYPMQAGGAEMTRLACCLATEAGVMVCCPVHDALLIEAAEDEIDGAVDTTRKAMAMASRVVLDGIEVPTDFKAVRWPDRYADPRGADMWQRVMGLLQVSGV
jgi:hypothetical protein